MAISFGLWETASCAPAADSVVAAARHSVDSCSPRDEAKPHLPSRIRLPRISAAALGYTAFMSSSRATTTRRAKRWHSAGYRDRRGAT
jgi:hypothetical protein